MLTVVHNKAVEEATSVYDPSSLLFGLDEYVVIEVSRVDDDGVRVVIEPRAREL